MSLDCKATGKLGAVSRGGQPRGEDKARAHDFGGTEQEVPCGIGDEETAPLYGPFGSAAKTSDFLVDTLTAGGQGLSAQEQHAIDRGQLTMDNGPESSGGRTQFLSRMGPLGDTIGNPLQVLSYPPYHSKYNPIARWGGILELHGNGTLLHPVGTMLAWAQSMTWKGIKPIITLRRKICATGVTLSKTAMQAVEARLERTPLFPKWDILILPARPT